MNAPAQSDIPPDRSALLVERAAALRELEAAQCYESYSIAFQRLERIERQLKGLP